MTGVTPALGPSGGGLTVTINGTNLANATHVYFGAAPAVITADSATQITATSPAGAPLTRVDITVTTAGGTSATSAADQFTFVSEPTLQSLSATQGPAMGGTTVTITGADLAGGNVVVEFGANPATILSNNGTQIVAVSPAGAAGPVDVTVVTAGGTTPINRPADQFTYTVFGVTVNVGSSQASSVFGQAVTFSADIVPQSQGLPIPLGTANLVIDGTTVQQQVAVLNGVVTFAPIATLGLTPGTPHTVEVDYNGDPNFASNSNTLAGGQTVNVAQTTTAVVANSPGNTSAFGQSVTFTATVSVTGPGGTSAGVPTGIVTFLDGTAVLGTGAVQNNSGVYQATLTTKALVLGSQTISADFSGNSDFAASDSLVQIETIQNSRITLVSSVEPAQVTKSVTLTVTVSACGHGQADGDGDLPGRHDGARHAQAQRRRPGDVHVNQICARRPPDHRPLQRRSEFHQRRLRGVQPIDPRHCPRCHDDDVGWAGRPRR